MPIREHLCRKTHQCIKYVCSTFDIIWTVIVYNRCDECISDQCWLTNREQVAEIPNEANAMTDRPTQCIPFEIYHGGEFLKQRIPLTKINSSREKGELDLLFLSDQISAFGRVPRVLVRNQCASKRVRLFDWNQRVRHDVRKAHVSFSRSRFVWSY